MTRKNLAFGCLAVLIVAALAAWLVPREAPEAYEFPAVSDIANMEAEFSVEEIERKFVVPSALYDEILAALSPAQFDSRPAKWVILGTLKIRTVDDKSIRVDLFDLSDPVGAFAAEQSWESWKRKYYRGGNSARLRSALEHALADSTEGGQRPEPER
jgi:hypothetical protein